MQRPQVWVFVQGTRVENSSSNIYWLFRERNRTAEIQIINKAALVYHFKYKWSWSAGFIFFIPDCHFITFTFLLMHWFAKLNSQSEWYLTLTAWHLFQLLNQPNSLIWGPTSADSAEDTVTKWADRPSMTAWCWLKANHWLGVSGPLRYLVIFHEVCKMS